MYMILNTLLNMYIEKDNIQFVHNERATTLLCLRNPLYPIKIPVHATPHFVIILVTKYM